MTALHPFPRLAIPLALLLVPALAGCASDGPPAEVTGSSSIAFEHRPLGSVEGDQVVWTTRVRNQDNVTSAPATMKVTIRSSVTQASTERSVPVPALPAQGSAEVKARTPYDGFGDYSGMAELLVGSRAVARAIVFYEKCPPTQLC